MYGNKQKSALILKGGKFGGKNTIIIDLHFNIIVFFSRSSHG